MKEIVEELIKRKETIATMESCTGGALASAITNIPSSSEIIKFSAVTYSNEYKIKMGVSKEIIDKYSVYSVNTAHEMAFNISKYAKSDFGVGITGKLNKEDPSNSYGKNNQVFVSIYYKEKYYDIIINVENISRKDNKDIIIKAIEKKLSEILWKD
ncbi:MAG: nicotinamide-nucleotide amidohydrolase family protein [Bacilli bacterium]|nr:nicotinamide-nucleotide amidohydrolase family protein [Bacilli bacterium]